MGDVALVHAYCTPYSLADEDAYARPHVSGFGNKYRRSTRRNVA